MGFAWRLSAVPHSPVSGNVSSTRGLPLAGPGIGSTPLLGGMSLKISFIPSGSRCPVAGAATSPSSTLQTMLLCILAVHIPSVSWCLGVEAAFRPLSQRVAPVAVMFAAASSQEERHRLRRPLSPLGGGSLHPGWRPRDVNRGAGPCGQVTERWE